MITVAQLQWSQCNFHTYHINILPLDRKVNNMVSTNNLVAAKNVTAAIWQHLRSL